MGVLSIVMTVVVLTASASLAANEGLATQGSLPGEETEITTGVHYGSGPEFCLETDTSAYAVSLDGDFEAGPTSNITWSGEVALTWETTTDYWIAPEGIYGSATHSGGCVANSLGAGIATSTVTLEGGDTTNGFICSGLTGSYSRVGMDITVVLTGSCTVYDFNSTSSATTPSNTVYTFEGTLNPCNPDVDPCTSSTITGGSLVY